MAMNSLRVKKTRLDQAMNLRLIRNFPRVLGGGNPKEIERMMWENGRQAGDGQKRDLLSKRALATRQEHRQDHYKEGR
jgi:hypothetical protein